MANTSVENQKRWTNLFSGLSCRFVLNIMVISGFMLNYALRVNLTIAIVEMIQPNSTTNGTSLSNVTETAAATTQQSNVNDEKFDWDPYQKNLILGAFFWGYVMTELPGGRLAELIGGRRVFGHSMLWASVINLLTPACAHFSYVALIISRVLIGFMLGASWPAILPMTAVWIPPLQRSKFIANMMASSLGAAITMPLCGFLISYFGWASVFYSIGGLGLLWSVLWFMIIHDSPAVHPRISPEERREIEDAIGNTTSKKRLNYFPWRSLITSMPVWAIIITHGCSVFCYFTVLNQLPTYMKEILKFDIKSNGIVSALPYLGKYVMAVCASYLADRLRTNGKLNTTQTRKIFTAFAVFSPGLVMVVQYFMGENKTWAVVCFTLALTLNGAVTAGYLGNGLDIAPNFSGTIFGLANTLSSSGGFISTYMVAAITYGAEADYSNWQIVFIVLAIAYVFGGSFFTIFGSGELQSWNSPPEQNGTNEIEEGVPLKSGNKPAITSS